MLQTAVYHNTLFCKTRKVSCILTVECIECRQDIFFNCLYPLRPNRLLFTGNVENFCRIKRTECEAYHLHVNSIEVHNAYSQLFMPKIITKKSITGNKLTAAPN